MAKSNHHYVPQFYLRHFSNGSGQIRVYRPGTDLDPYVTSTRNIAAEKAFYTAELGPGSETDALEQLLSQIEAEAREAIAFILAGHFPPSSSDRRRIARLLGYQIMRTPERREILERSVEAFFELATEAMTREEKRAAWIEASGDDSEEGFEELLEAFDHHEDKVRLHRNEHLKAILTISEELGIRLLDRSWILGRSAGRAHFITSDHPLIDVTEIPERGVLMGLGLHYAQFFMFPLDPRRILVFASPGLLEEKAYDFDDAQVGLVNQLTASYAHLYVFQHPDDPRVDRVVPKVPREIAPPQEIARTVTPFVTRALKQFRATQRSE
jgi:hypothetical protein